MSKVAVLSVIVIILFSVESVTTAQEHMFGPGVPEVKKPEMRKLSGDPYSLYKEKGRKWKHKSTTIIEGMDPFISYMEYEITELTEDSATQKMTMYDKDNKPYEGMEPTEHKIAFEGIEDVEGDVAAPEHEVVKITVEAGEFECWMTEHEESKTWISFEYSGLIIKMTAKMVEMELVEWNAGGDTDDASDSPEKPVTGDKANDDSDPFALYKKEGRKWKHKSVTSIEGMDDMISFMEYEIIEVTEKHAVQKMTMTDKNGEPFAGVKPTETTIKFKIPESVEDDDEIEAPEMESETIKVEAGEFECHVTDLGGTKVWSSIKFPGLLVKMEGESNSMELVEFTE
ncbi:MAG: hypothetical protein ACYTDT_06795 [Planctomycetota bacterium]|jgi:hypothetical protein